MNRSLTALFAAFEAALVVAIGIGISLAPLTILWAAQFGFAIDWLVFWRAAVDIWLVGHGVDINFQLDAVAAAQMGLPGAEAAFAFTIAPLGFALITVLLGIRAGSRVAESRFRLLGEAISISVFAALSALVTLSALHPQARPSISQGIVLPTLVFALGVLIGSLRTHTRLRDAPAIRFRTKLTTWSNDLPPALWDGLRIALRGGAATVAAVVAAASIVLAALFAINYAEIVALYESLHAEALGGAAITLAQIALIPNLVIWTAAWIVGPGFAVGVGSSVGPLGTQLGPIPAVPVFGALPTGEPVFGFLGLLVPIVLAFLVAAIIGRSLPPRPLLIAGSALGMGLVAGLLLGGLAWISAGSAGPGRLVQVGPEPLSVALVVALEVAVAAAAGLFAASRTRRGQEAGQEEAAR